MKQDLSRSIKETITKNKCIADVVLNEAAYFKGTNRSDKHNKLVIKAPPASFKSTRLKYLMQPGSLIPTAQFEDHIYVLSHPEAKN